MLRRGRRQRGAQEADGNTAEIEIVLRRKSWKPICLIFTVGLGVALIFAIISVTEESGFRVGFQGIPVYLGAVGVIWRILGCRILLTENTLIVVNPLRTSAIPKHRISEVGVNSGGGLEIILDNEESIGSFAYGGSMIDNFIFQSSRDAAYRIARWAKTEEGSEEGGEPPVACNFRWTRAGLADLALLAAVATGTVAALWSAIKAS